MIGFDDLDDFFEVDDFADLAIFTRVGGSAISVSGIFDAPQASRSAGDMLEVTAPSPQFLCTSADVMGVSEGDELTVRGVDYTVRVVLTDGTGVTTLILERS